MIRELILLFSVRVHGSWSLPRCIHLSTAHRSGSLEQLCLTCSFFLFFRLRYQTWWKDTPVIFALVWDTAVDSRLHRYWRHLVRCWYSILSNSVISLWSILKDGIMQKTWVYPWRVQTHNFLVSNCFLAANVFAIIGIRNKAECATNSVTEAAHYKLLSISCILKWMSRRYSVNEHKYPYERCQCFFMQGRHP